MWNRFIIIYEKLLRGQQLSNDDKNTILKITAYLLMAGNQTIHKLAYMIALKYGQCTHDYSAATDIANMLHYYPVVKLLMASTNPNEPIIINADSLLDNALAETYKDEYYKSKQQYLLSQIVATQEDVTAIAPTSYGKSKMILEKMLKYYNSGKTTCILTPTKSLLSQTLHELVILKGDRHNVVVHPDAVYDNSAPLIAIFTQERLSSFLVKYPGKVFDYIFVDEAHNIMSDDTRSLTLSRDLIIAKTRNPNLKIDYFSPFVICPKESLSLISPLSASQQERCIYQIDEYMKVPKYTVWSKKDQQLIIYDQFTGIQVSSTAQYDDYTTFIVNTSSEKNIIYANTPRQVEQFANKLASILPLVDFTEKDQTIINELCTTLSDTVHKAYTLINLLQHGIIINHGKMLDNIKDYTETLYRKIKGIRYVITTSTLLEGVNLPAGKLFMLNYYKARGNLTFSAFHNLVGRIARLNQVFDLSRPDPELLTPEVCLLDGPYLNNKSHDPISFLDTNAKEGSRNNDKIDNPLLSAYKKPDADAKRNNHVTIMANTDAANLSSYSQISSGNIQMAKTKVGKLLYTNNVFANTIPTAEQLIEKIVTSINRNMEQSPTEVVY